MKGRKNMISNKRLVSAVTIIVTISTITICLLGTVGALQSVQLKTGSNTVTPSQLNKKAPMGPNPRGIVWDVQMNFSEIGGKIDSAYFGEATDANDGPPVDSYDTMKPPAPMPPYLRTWFNDSLPMPYNNLWKDYRYYPGITKVWNLSIQWFPSDYVSPTTVTISWNTVKINTSEYDQVSLYNSTGVLKANMRTTGNYIFTCPAMIPQKYAIVCKADTAPPQIINHSPGVGETGDSFTFNASVFDDLTPSSSLLVKVNWTNGGPFINDTMTYVTGNYFEKTIILSNYTTNPLTYHIYAKDNANTPNINYTVQYSATISDDETPIITSVSGPVSVGTGDKVTLWVTATDNIAVTSVKVTVDVTEYSMVWNGTSLRWEYVYTAPVGSTAGHTYFVKVSDVVPNTVTSGTFGITVNDNDAPVITGTSGAVSVGTGDKVTLWVTATDNIAVTSVKVTVDVTEYSMVWNGTSLRWEYVYTAPVGSTAGHTYFVKVSDVVPNTVTSGTFGITVNDNDAPVITGTSGAVSVGTGDKVTLWVTATDNIAVTSVKVTVDVTEYSMVWNGTSLRWEYVYTAPVGSTAGHTYFVKVSDVVPNTVTSGTFGITVNDNDAPVITGTSGAVSVGTGDKVTLWVTATDNIAVTSVKVTVDVTEYSMVWNGTSLRWEYVYTAPVGSTAGHTYFVKVSDVVPNTVTSGTFGITVNDNDAPVITGTSGAVSVGTGDKVTLWVTATDNIAVTSVKVTVDVTEYSMVWNGTSLRWEYVYTAPVGSTAGHTYFVKVSDVVPNTVTSGTFGITVNDNDAPVITGTSGAVSVGTGDKVTLWVTATDNIAVTSVKVTVDVTEYSMVWNGTSLRWEYVYTAPVGSTAGHTYFVKVSDVVPNTVTSGTFGITVNDNDAPVITGTSGAVSVGTGDKVTLWVTATDNIAVTSVKVTVDVTEYSMVWNGTSLRWEYVYTAPVGSTAGHTYFVKVSDVVPNTVTSGTFGITVNDNDPPVITNIIATPSSQLVNGYVNITATISDNINLLEKKIRITGPSGFTPVNITMTQDGGNAYYYNTSYTILGTYNYSLWAKDTNNNAVTTIIYHFDIFSNLQITTMLVGWNFVSLPFNQTITKTNLFVMYSGTRYNWSDAVTQGIVVNNIFGWNRSGQGYIEVNALAPGFGYWIFAYHNCEIWGVIQTPIITTNYITDIHYRWNIFGVPVGGSLNKTSLIIRWENTDYNWTQATTNQNPTNQPIIISTIFGWKRTPPQGYILCDILDAGYSYWIYAYQPCTLKRST